MQVFHAYGVFKYSWEAGKMLYYNIRCVQNTFQDGDVPFLQNKKKGHSNKCTVVASIVSIIFSHSQFGSASKYDLLTGLAYTSTVQ